jgi:hypothetical protein
VLRLQTIPNATYYVSSKIAAAVSSELQDLEGLISAARIPQTTERHRQLAAAGPSSESPARPGPTEPPVHPAAEKRRAGLGRVPNVVWRATEIL